MMVSTASHTVPRAPWIASSDVGHTAHKISDAMQSKDEDQTLPYKSPCGSPLGISDWPFEIFSTL